MAKTLHFLGGLPRAGSTLIANVLAQNPRFHTTSTSGLLSFLIGIRQLWEKNIAFKTMPKAQAEAAKLRVLRAAVGGFFADVTRPVIFDKGRGWLGHIPLAEAVLGRRIKIIAPVRDVRDIIASFERLATKNVLKPTGQEMGSGCKWETVDGRADIWMARNGVVGVPYRQMREAITRGLANRILFVDYDEFTVNPGQQMLRIYRFLGEEPFQHDFDHVEQVTEEDDDVWHMPGLHKIRPKVEPQPPLWPKVLPREVAVRFPARQAWMDLRKRRSKRISAPVPAPAAAAPAGPAAPAAPPEPLDAKAGNP